MQGLSVELTGGSICIQYIYSLYLIQQFNWCGVPVCKASMLDWSGGGLSAFALIDNIEQQRGRSVLWQFWMGGSSAFGIYICTGI